MQAFDLKDLEDKKSLQGRYWRHRSCDERAAAALSQKLGVPDVIGRLMAARGISVEDGGGFLNPSLKNTLPNPFQLKDMARAAERVVQAILSGEKIAILGDYDVDGATSSALIKRFLQALPGGIACDPLIYIPDRMKEGYGPNAGAFDILKAQGAGVVITVDCGTTAFAALAHGRSLQLDVIVLDHHTPETKLPEAYAVVNPNRLDEDPSDLQKLAAVGVSFLFVIAINRLLREKEVYSEALGKKEPNLLDLLDLVALGTVCDVMPLTGLNRVFVAQGLKIMARRNNEGLRVLLDLLVPNEPPESYHLGYVLGPRINAGGRIGQSDLGCHLLSTGDSIQALEIAEELNTLNSQRRDIEASTLQEALGLIEGQPPACGLVLASPGWHPGVIGILASRLKDLLHHPVCVVAVEGQEGKGSGRSIPGIDLGRIIHRAVHLGLLLKGGGHAMAAGFTVASEKISAFQTFFAEECQRLGADQETKPTLMLDSGLSLQGATPEFLLQLNQLAPFGVGNSTPRFVFPFVRLKNIRRLGQSEDVLHIGCHLENELSGGRALSAVGFRLQKTALGDALLNGYGKLFHVAGTLKSETWRGQKSVKLIIDDAHFA